MKTFVTWLSVSAAAGLVLSGCSKKSDAVANNASGAAVSSASVTSGGSATTGPIDLKLKWQAGKRYDMKVDVDQTTDVKTPNGPNHSEIKVTQNFHYSPLKDLDNGGHEVEMDFDNQSLDVFQNDKDVLSYDSTQKKSTPPAGPSAAVAAVMGAMLGVPLDYTFAANGALEKIDGVDALTNRINAALPDQRQQMSLQQLFDDDTLKQYGTFSEALPDHPVNVGDSWSSSHDINNPAGVLTVDSTYTFKDREQHNGYDCVHLLLNGNIKTKTASAATIGAVVKIGKGAINGEAWFAPDLGMVVDLKNDQDLTLNITTRTMNLTENMKVKMETSLLSVSP
ncbi:MAG TPA: DUF6263 family protein [Verrucomicrobiae bacterium]|jgi:hypothetical protein|nr:DUF6263 family protein [Verrucomicrobiae bacterium]